MQYRMPRKVAANATNRHANATKKNKQTKGRTDKSGDGPINKAWGELEEASKGIKISRKRLSRAAHKLLLEGMEYDAHGTEDGPTIANATHFLDDEKLSIACDTRKYNHTDPTINLEKVVGHAQFSIHATVMENITCIQTQKKRVDKHGQFNVFKEQREDVGYVVAMPYEETITLSASIDEMIRTADQHIVETPRYFSVVLSNHGALDSVKGIIDSYLIAQGLNDTRPHTTQRSLRDYFIHEVQHSTNAKGTNIIWEPNPAIHRHKSSDYEVAVIEQKGMIQNTAFMEHAEYKLSINKRLVFAGLGNMKGSKFVVCEEIIIQIMKRHEDAVDEHIKFHPTSQALLISARPLHSGGSTPNKTNIHFFGNNAFSVDMTANPAMSRIDRAESAMVSFGWILKQLQNITAHNMQHTKKAEVFFRNFIDEGNPWLTKLNELRKIRNKPDLSTTNSLQILRESFLGRQKAIEVVAVKDNAFPRTKLWYATPTFAVIVVSPVENPAHNYIMVQTFPCTHVKTTIKHVLHRKDAMYHRPVTTPKAPRDERHAPSPTPRQAVRSSSYPPRDRMHTEFTPFKELSRLPEDLEFELQML